MLHTVIVMDAAQKDIAVQLLAAVRHANKEYPTYTGWRLSDELTNGKTPEETVSFKVIDPLLLEWTYRTKGRVTATGIVSFGRWQHPDSNDNILQSRRAARIGKSAGVRKAVRHTTRV